MARAFENVTGRKMTERDEAFVRGTELKVIEEKKAENAPKPKEEVAEEKPESAEDEVAKACALFEGMLAQARARVDELDELRRKAYAKMDALEAIVKAINAGRGELTE